jgi:hypothetical protein
MIVSSYVLAGLIIFVMSSPRCQANYQHKVFKRSTIFYLYQTFVHF